MKISYFKLVVILFISSFGFSQETILSSEINEVLYFKDLPTITYNNNGTITLTHNDQFITNIFAKYEIYDFNEIDVGNKWYVLSFNNKDLIVELSEKVSSEIIDIINGYIGFSNYTATPINPEFIEFVDGKKFSITNSIIIWSDKAPNTKEDIPNDFDLKVEFNYNTDDDLLLMKNVGDTPCGNSFSIGIKGTSNNNLTLWKTHKTTPISSLNTESYCEIERALYTILDLNDGSAGDIYYSMNTENSTLKISKNTPAFGYLEVTFQEESLSTQRHHFSKLKFYETNSSPCLHVKNIQNKEFYIEIKSINGKTLQTKRILKDNNINISILPSGIYFIKIYTPVLNQIKVFKFLKK